MAGETEAAALRDLLTTTKDGDWGKDSPAEGFVPYRVIRGTDFPSVRLGDTSSVPIRYLSESTVHRRTLAADDILLETAGGSPDRPTGRSLLIKQQLLSALDLPATCASFARFLRVDRNKVEPQYVYWFLQYLYASGQMEKHQVQHTGVARFQYTKFAESQEIRLPHRNEQRAIARILGTLDDKIDLNRRMNETLEAMARELFKSWFVDFDPVRAKAEGRLPAEGSAQAGDPGLPKPLAELFPDSFEDSELGEIPRGWEVKSLGELVATVKGRSYKSEELVESDTALVTLKSFARGGGYRPDGLKSFAGTYKPDQVVKPGELVIACTDVTQAAEVIGRPAIVRGTSGYRTLVASLDTLIVRPNQSTVTRAFLYFLGGTEAFVTHTYAHTTGTTVLHLAKEAVPSFTFALPSQRLVDQFDSLASPTLGRIQALEEESDTLAALRDVLLPKLICGELRVRDAKRVIEAAV